jgi:glycosyltransferase involved in cell wall biosynthesis
MKIGIVAPLQEIVPPDRYGGTELVVFNLIGELINRGHKVTLFARAESKTPAKLVSLGIDKSQVEVVDDRYINGYLLACEVIKRSSDFDIINNHAGWRFIFFAPKLRAPLLNTNHTLFYDKFHPILKTYSEYPYTSISMDQQKKAPKEIKFVKNIYNGIDKDAFKPSFEKGKYFFWMGRLIEKKGADIAIKVAKKLKKKLIIAGPIVKDRPEDIKYYEKKVKPYINNKDIVYFGPANHKEKTKLYRESLAFLNPIGWDEPFGLVVPESNACGTPVVSFRLGAMNEIMKDGVNGYSVNASDVNQFIAKTEEIIKLSNEEYIKLRKSSRKFFEENFTIDKMVDGYIEAYKKTIGKDY